MILALSALVFALVFFKRSMNAITEGLNFDCMSARFFSSGERVLKAPDSRSSIIISEETLAGAGEGAVPREPPTFPACPGPIPAPFPAPTPPPLPAAPFAFTELEPDLVTEFVLTELNIARLWDARPLMGK